MAKVIYAPNELDNSKFTIFLAGSIDMGKAKDWQKEIEDKLKDEDVILFNPRRGDWDSSWVQSITNPEFREQVEWELNSMDKADMIIYYFDDKGMSPITLMELGLHKDDNIVVCCPEEYERKGNVDVVCNKYDIKQVDDIDGLVKEIKTKSFSLDESIKNKFKQLIK